MVGLHQSRYVIAMAIHMNASRCRACAPLEFVAHHARATAYISFGNGPRTSVANGIQCVLRRYVLPVDIVKHAIIGFADHRHGPYMMRLPRPSVMFKHPQRLPLVPGTTALSLGP